MKKFIIISILVVMLFIALSSTNNQNKFTISSLTAATTQIVLNEYTWQDVNPSEINQKGERYIVPVSYRALHLNKMLMKDFLQSAPLESHTKAINSNVIIKLPMPDGSVARFSISESPVMEQALQDQFPDIRTYLGQGIDNRGASVRLDMTPSGFHAMILSPEETVFIDPYSMNETEYYISYTKNDFRSSVPKPFECHTTNQGADNTPNYSKEFDVTGEQLRTYRLAIGATGEYTAFHGGTVPTALAAITTSVNRITGVYEKDLCVRMILVANQTSVIYTNASTDPYTNNNGVTMLSQNQANLDAVIGNANYDIGHVYSTWSGGGIANLNAVCNASTKARGVTGSNAPVGDPWDIDYVAHEMGHQFSGDHTQNNSNCNANPSTAWEPGSGITIMGYAGVCAPNLANNSIPYMHGGSIFDEMIPYTQAGIGSNCPTVTPTGNIPPVVSVPGGGFTIPISTPFALTGSATDPGDVLTYSWEQHDVGPQGHPNNPSGNAPIFRPFPPVSTGTRLFPKLSDLLNNTQTLGEILPTYSRSLSFYLTVRDNRVGGGGVALGQISFNVTNTAGPFLVTSPNTAVTWPALSNQTVTWNVANTNAAPVSTANVRILLSTDGGNTFPTILLASTPNDGSELVAIPNQQTTTARIKIEAVGNIYFDLSNTNFTISSPVGISGNEPEIPLEFGLHQNYPNPFNPSTFIGYSIPYNSEVTLQIYDLQGKQISTLINNELRTAGNHSIEFDASLLPSGVYYYSIKTAHNTAVKKMILIK